MHRSASKSRQGWATLIQAVHSFQQHDITLAGGCRQRGNTHSASAVHTTFYQVIHYVCCPVLWEPCNAAGFLRSMKYFTYSISCQAKSNLSGGLRVRVNRPVFFQLRQKHSGTAAKMHSKSTEDEKEEEIMAASCGWRDRHGCCSRSSFIGNGWNFSY